jgi:hypothetical protein
MAEYSKIESTSKPLFFAFSDPELSRRNMAIFDMWLNGLGIPDVFQEVVSAIFVAGNWDRHEELEEITQKRLARALSPMADEPFHKVFNRLKKKIPEFFNWQEEKDFVIIYREKIQSYQTNGKVKVRYGFPHYAPLMKLFLIDPNASQRDIRTKVEEECKRVVSLKIRKDEKAQKIRDQKSWARSVAKAVKGLRESSADFNNFIVELHEILEKDVEIAEKHLIITQLLNLK